MFIDNNVYNRSGGGVVFFYSSAFLVSSMKVPKGQCYALYKLVETITPVLPFSEDP